MNLIGLLKSALLLAYFALTSACGSQEPKPALLAPADPLAWVEKPSLERGIADTQCLLAYPGSQQDALQAAATLNARVGLSRKINQQASLMDREYRRMSTAQHNAPQHSGGAQVQFETAAAQLAVAKAERGRAIRADYVELPPDSKSNYCVMVALDEQSTKALFDELISSAGLTLSEAQQAALYQRFVSAP